MPSISLTANVLGTADPTAIADDSSIPNSPFCYPGVIYPSEVAATVTASAASPGTVTIATASPGTANPSTNTPGTANPSTNTPETKNPSTNTPGTLTLPPR